MPAALRGDITVTHVTVKAGDRETLKDVSLTVKAGSRTAVIGPTAAGKSQLLYVLAGLLDPASGAVDYDGRNLADYDKTSMHQQVALVFQDATLFNLTLRENIGFSRTATDADLAKAIATAELADFVAALPQGLDTIVAERGSSLSGGQKQRIMLARALALNPRVLLLDDFTARVDARTEQQILENVRTQLPGRDAGVGHPEDRAGRGLRPDRPADGGRGAGHRHAPARSSRRAPSTPRSMSPSEAPAITSRYRLSAPQPQASPPIAASLRRLAPVLSDERRRLAVALTADDRVVGDGAARAGDHRADHRHLHPEPATSTASSSRPACCCSPT